MPELPITSSQNSLIKQVIGLRDAKNRRDEGLTLIDGLREIQRAMDAGVDIEKVFSCPPMLQGKEDRTILAKLKAMNTPLIEVSSSIFEKIAFGQRLEGLLAMARTPDRSLSHLKPSAHSLFVIAQALEKPGNIGAILRTCDAARVDGLILVDAKTDLFNPNVIRASTGTVFTVPTAIADSQTVLDFLKRYKIRTLGLFPQSQSLYTEVDMTGSTAVVLGSEDKGLNDFWKKHSDVDMKIPMSGKADSLNVSVCAAIVIYEAIRQRGSIIDPSVLRRSAKKF
jgi:TrmH family RNA methyltransferase